MERWVKRLRWAERMDMGSGDGEGAGEQGWREGWGAGMDGDEEAEMGRRDGHREQ